MSVVCGADGAVAEAVATRSVRFAVVVMGAPVARRPGASRIVGAGAGAGAGADASMSPVRAAWRSLSGEAEKVSASLAAWFFSAAADLGAGCASLAIAVGLPPRPRGGVRPVPLPGVAKP